MEIDRRSYVRYTDNGKGLSKWNRLKKKGLERNAYLYTRPRHQCKCLVLAKKEMISERPGRVNEKKFSFQRLNLVWLRLIAGVRIAWPRSSRMEAKIN